MCRVQVKREAECVEDELRREPVRRLADAWLVFGHLFSPKAAPRIRARRCCCCCCYSAGAARSVAITGAIIESHTVSTPTVRAASIRSASEEACDVFGERFAIVLGLAVTIA